MELIIGIIFFSAAIACSSLKFVIEHERFVVYRMGRVTGARGPGPVWLWPLIDRYIKVDMRLTSMNVPLHLLTADNQSVVATAVCSVQVEDAHKLVTNINDVGTTLTGLVSSTLAGRVHRYKLENLAVSLEEITADALSMLKETSAPWGVRFSSLELKDIRATSQLESLGDKLSQSSATNQMQAWNATEFGGIAQTAKVNVSQTSASAGGDYSATRASGSLPVRQTEEAQEREPSGNFGQSNYRQNPCDREQEPVARDPGLPSTAAVGIAEPGTDQPVTETQEDKLSLSEDAGGEPESVKFTPADKLDMTDAPGVQLQGDGLSLPQDSGVQLQEAVQPGPSILAAPAYAMAQVTAAGYSGLELLMQLPQRQNNGNDTAAPTFPLSSTLTGVITGRSSERCSKCDQPLEGLLCFNCWELN